MSRFVYDSTNPSDDPSSAQLVAYYIDGLYAFTESAVRALFPNAILIPISAIGTNNGIVGDVEPGCMTIQQGIVWVQERRAAGLDPTLYVNEVHGWGPARLAFHTAGIPEPHWWVADYDGIAVVPSGAVAKQFANSAMTGGHFDLSVALDFWPGVDNVFGPVGSQGDNNMATKQDIEDALNALGMGGGVTSIFNELVKLNAHLADLATFLKVQNSAAPVLEPTQVTLEFPAQTVKGKLT